MQQSHFEIILEDMQAKVDLILEVLAPLTPLPERLDLLEDKVDGIASDVSAIKVGMGLHSGKLADHDKTLKSIL